MQSYNYNTSWLKLPQKKPFYVWKHSKNTKELELRGNKTFKFKILNHGLKVQHLLFPLKMKTKLIYQLKFFLSKAPPNLLDITFSSWKPSDSNWAIDAHLQKTPVDNKLWKPLSWSTLLKQKWLLDYQKMAFYQLTDICFLVWTESLREEWELWLRMCGSQIFGAPGPEACAGPELMHFAIIGFGSKNNLNGLYFFFF